MAILKTSEQVKRAEPAFLAQKWLVAVFQTKASRETELRRDSSRIPAYPEIRNSAEIVFYIRVSHDSETVTVGMAADPKAPSAEQRIHGFIDWAADHRLDPMTIKNIDAPPHIAAKLEQRRDTPDADERSGARPASWKRRILIILIAGAVVIGALLAWRRLAG